MRLCLTASSLEVFIQIISRFQSPRFDLTFTHIFQLIRNDRLNHLMFNLNQYIFHIDELKWAILFIWNWFESSGLILDIVLVDRRSFSIFIPLVFIVFQHRLYFKSVDHRIQTTHYIPNFTFWDLNSILHLDPILCFVAQKIRLNCSINGWIFYLVLFSTAVPTFHTCFIARNLRSIAESLRVALIVVVNHWRQSYRTQVLACVLMLGPNAIE